MENEKYKLVTDNPAIYLTTKRLDELQEKLRTKDDAVYEDRNLFLSIPQHFRASIKDQWVHALIEAQKEFDEKCLKNIPTHWSQKHFEQHNGCLYIQIFREAYEIHAALISDILDRLYRESKGMQISPNVISIAR